MRRTVLLLVFALLLAAPLVHAAEPFNATLRPIIDTIRPDEAARYELSVTNLENSSDAFVVSTDDLSWIADTVDVLSDVAPQSTRVTTLELSAQGELSPGTRLVTVKVRSSNTKGFVPVTAAVSVQSANASGRQYEPSIYLSARVGDHIDPREPITLSVYLRNRNARDYPALLVTVASQLVTKQYATTLGPVTGDDGEKTNQLSLQIDPQTPMGSYPLEVTIAVDNKTVNSFQTNLAVISYDDEARAHESTSSWFKTTTTYTVTNHGNTARVFTVTHPSGFFARLFLSSAQSYDVTPARDGVVFTARLDPQQRAEFVVVENYRLLAILVAVIILSVVAYFLFRSPVLLEKEASIKGSSADGVSEMRIRLHIRNRSARAVHNLHVIDKVTSMADVLKEATLGTLQPTKVVKKPGHGTLIRWDLDTLDAFEERIISYTVKTKLKLIGDVYLPAVKVKFDQGGRERTAYSNEVNIAREN